MSRSDSTEAFVKLGFILIFGGGGMLWNGLKRMRQVRKIEDTACSEIRSAAQGLVEIQGHAFPGINLGLPIRCLEDRECVFHHLKVEKHVKRGKNSSWVTIFEETVGNEFMVSDGTGIASVLVDGAELALAERQKKLSAFSEEERMRLSERYGMRIEGLGVSTGSFSSFFSAPIRVTERKIRVAAPVYVRGKFQTISGMKPYLISPHHLAFLGKIAEIRLQPGWKKKHFDLDRDGNLSEEEAVRGSERLLYLAKKDVKVEEKAEPVSLQGILSKEPEHGLLIGDAFQEHLTRRLGNANLWRVIGGAAGVAAGTVMFILAFTR